MRDVIGGRAQPREAPGERLGGEGAGEERDGEREHAAHDQPALDRRDLLLDVAQRRFTSSTPSSP